MSDSMTVHVAASGITDDMLAALKKPLPREAIKQHPTKKYLSTIKAIYVVERFNEVFGLGNWFVGNEVVEASGKMIVVKSTFTAPKWGIEHEAFGGHDNEDRGDAYKGACTDALTKIASYLYVGMDVYKGLGAGPLKNACVDCGEECGGVHCADRDACWQRAQSDPQFTGQTIKQLETTVATVVDGPDGADKPRGTTAAAKTGSVPQETSDPNLLRVTVESSTSWPNKFKKGEIYYDIRTTDRNDLTCTQEKLFKLVHILKRGDDVLFRVQKAKKDGTPYKKPYVQDVLMVNGQEYQNGIPLTKLHTTREDVNGLPF